MVLNLALKVHIEPEDAGHFSSAYDYVVGEIHRYLTTPLIFSVPEISTGATEPWSRE